MTSKFTIALASYVFGCALMASSLSAMEPIRDNQLVQNLDFPLAPVSKRQFNRFKRTQAAFGSFYASKDGVQNGWSFAMFSQAAADKLAKTYCEAGSANTCVLYAQVKPKDALGNMAIPKVHQSTFNDLKRNMSSGRYAAIAVNGSGGVGFAANDKKNPLPTPENARALALDLCNRSSQSTQRELPEDLSSAFARSGLFECRVVSVFLKK